MAEYIEREVLIKWLPQKKCVVGDMYALGYNTCLQAVRNVINNLAPAADVVEVQCRCKECRLYNEQYHYVGEETGRVYSDGYCRHWDHEVCGDDFCSYGERRNDVQQEKAES